MVERIMCYNSNIISQLRYNQKKSFAKEIATILYSLSKEATKIIGADRATLYIYDKDKEELFSYVVSELEIDEIRLKIGEGIAGKAALLREPIIENDAPNCPYFNPFYDSQTNYKTKQVITNPLVNDQNELIGVIQLLNKKNGEFNLEDLEKLKILSNVITIAIEQMKITLENTLLKEYNRRLIENLDAAVIVVDSNNIIQDYNNKFLEMFNLSGDLYGKNIMAEIKPITEYINGNRSINKEIKIGRKYYHIISSLLKDTEENNLGNLFIITDITERVMESKKKETDERMSILGKMTSQLIHDIKNPLFVLRGYLKLVSQCENLSEISKYTSMMDKEIAKIIDITQEILDFSKGEIDVWVEYIDVDKLNSVIIDIIKEINTTFKVNIRYINDAKPDLKIKADVNKLERALRNIIINSIEAFSGTNNKIEVFVELKSVIDGVEIYIKDKGIGIPHEIRDDIFKLFFTNKKNGTGLGLSIAKAIIDKHKGSISLIDEPDWSTTFKIFLPMADN